MLGIEYLSHCTFLAAGYILCLTIENASQCRIKNIAGRAFRCAALAMCLGIVTASSSVVSCHVGSHGVQSRVRKQKGSNLISHLKFFAILPAEDLKSYLLAHKLQSNHLL